MRISDWSSDVCSSDLAPRGKVWRTSLGWGMALMFGMTSLAVYSMFTWLPKILTEAGATPAFGGTMLALYSALGLAGALSIPALAVRVANPFPLVLACAACPFAGFAGPLWAALAAAPPGVQLGVPGP